jgi:EAL domain-containing protein (putative c-di-GMP-specific phosphodiesterase class I)
MECDKGQGFYFSKPMDAVQTRAYLEASFSAKAGSMRKAG